MPKLIPILTDIQTEGPYCADGCPFSYDSILCNAFDEELVFLDDDATQPPIRCKGCIAYEEDYNKAQADWNKRLEDKYGPR